MKKFFKVLVNLIKILMIVFLLALIVFLLLSYWHIKNTDHEDKYLARIIESEMSPLEDCYYDVEKKSLIFNLSDELISSYVKFDALNREAKKYDMVIEKYGFDIDVDKKEVYLYLKVLYKDFVPLDGYVLFKYEIKNDVVLLDMQEIKVEDKLTISLEKLQKYNVKTNYWFKYPKVEISQMIVIDRNFLKAVSYDDDILVVRYSLFDYIYNHYKKIYEKGDGSYYIYQTIEKYGLDQYVENNYPYVIAELQNCGIEIRK